MKALIFFFITAIAGMFQVAFLDRFRFFGAFPDLFLALTIIAAVKCDSAGALAVGILIGMFKDVFEIGPFGFNTVIFPLTAVLVSRLNRTLSLDNAFACSVITALVLIAGRFGVWIMISFSQSGLPAAAFIRLIILEAFLTAVIMWPLLSLTRFAAARIK